MTDLVDGVRPLVDPRQLVQNGKLRMPMECNTIRLLLPHAWPFLFVDRVLSADPPRSILALRNVTYGEPHYLGHFPADAIMPGVLIIESLAQAGGLLIGFTHLVAAAEGRELPKSTGRYYVASVKRMRFRKLVRPGDQLRLAVEMEKHVGALCDMRATARVDGDVVAEGALTLAS